MIKDKTISLTSMEEGRLISRNGFFDEPFIGDKGRAKMKKVFRKGLLPSSVKIVTNLSESATIAFQKERPKHVPEFKWRHMSDMRRIKENLKRVVGNDNFTFDLL